jgi:glutaconate CoA-transferase subunit B
MEYTARELMVVCAARQIGDHERVFVGMRLPLIAYALARRTHAPNCVGLFESGTLRDAPAAELLYTMGDAPNVSGSLWATSTLHVMGLMATGEIDLGFIGGAEIDRYGNLNTSLIGDWQHPTVRLPGSGGGADIASLANRLAVMMPHERHRLRERVDFVTSPGYGYPGEHGPAGVSWRLRQGLPRRDSWPCTVAKLLLPAPRNWRSFVPVIPRASGHADFHPTSWSVHMLPEEMLYDRGRCLRSDAIWRRSPVWLDPEQQRTGSAGWRGR